LRLVQVTTVPLTLQNLFKGQVAYLKGRGFEVIGVSSPGEGLGDWSRREATAVHAVPMVRGISPAADLIALLRLWRLFLRIKPAIVHGSTAKAGVLSMIAATLARVPVRIYTLRGVMMEIRTGPAQKLLKGMEWIACGLADRVLAVSKSVADAVVEEGLCSPTKIRVLVNGSSNGVDARVRFNPARMDPRDRRRLRAKLGVSGDGIVVGFVGRIVRDKGIAELASAWMRIRDQYENAHLLILGPREPQDPVPAEVLEGLTSDSRVITIDLVPNEEMPQYYGAMDMLVLPSYREGFPNVVLEAAAMELPVVAARVTGCVDAVVDGVTGILVPPKDSGSLAAAMRIYLGDPPLRTMHGKAGREQVVRKFRPEPIWEALYDEYLAQIRKKGLPVPRTGSTEGKAVSTAS